MLRYLLLPAIAALLAAAIVAAPFFVAIPYLPQPRLLDAVLFGAAIFFFVLALANHVAATRLAGRLRARLAGLDEFDADLRRRVGKLETVLAQLALDQARQPAAGPAAERREAGAATTVAEADADDAKIIRFDPDARQRPVPSTARPAGARLADALEHDAIQAWFQPVVTLPGRKTRFLEAIAYLAPRDGDEAAPGRRIEPGYATDPEIDRSLLLQSLTLLRELDRAEKALGIIWPIHGTLLADVAAFTAVDRILEANSAFAGQLVARIDHRDYCGLDAGQIARLHRVRELGFAVALGRCPVPATNVEAVRSGLFSILFMDAARLIAAWLELDRPKSQAVAPPAGVEIIACDVASEEQAMALIDQDILLAQGDFFSQPRPLRRARQPGRAAGN